MIPWFTGTEHHLRFGVILSLVAAAWWQSPVLADEVETDSPGRERIEAIAASYLENRDSFKTLHCEYDLLRYSDFCEEQLIAGQEAPDVTASGIWLRNNATERYELNLTEDAIEMAFKTNHAPFDPYRVLVQGKENAFSFSALTNGGVVSSSHYPYKYASILTPFDYGEFSGARRDQDPALIFVHELRPFLKFRVSDAISEMDPLIESFIGQRSSISEVEYVIADKDASMKLLFGVDLMRGCLPIFGKLYINGKHWETMLVTDIKAVDGKRFFPMRSLHYQHRLTKSGNKQMVWAIENKVTRLKVDGPMDDSLFRIKIPDMCLVREGEDASSQFHLEHESQIGLEDIPRLLAMSRNESDRQKQLVSAINFAEHVTARRGSRFRSLVILNSAVAIIAVILLIVLRLRKNRRRK